jgi:hypothetical protein
LAIHAAFLNPASEGEVRDCSGDRCAPASRVLISDEHAPTSHSIATHKATSGLY